MVEEVGLVDIEGDVFFFCGRALMLSLSVVTLSCLELAEFRKGVVAPFCSVVVVDSSTTRFQPSVFVCLFSPSP